MNCKLSIFSNKVGSFTASLETSFTSFRNWEKQYRFSSEKNIVFPQNDFLAKDQIIESLLEKQTALLYKLVEQNHERSDQQHPISHLKRN